MISCIQINIYRVFYQLRQAKFVYGVSILSPSQFSLLQQLPQKTKLLSKVVKTGSKIIILLPSYVAHTWMAKRD